MQTKVTGVIGENFNFLSKPSLFSLSTLLRIRTKRGENGEGSGEKSLLRGVTYFRYCLTVLSRFPLVPLVTLVHIQNKRNCFDSARTKFGYFKNRDYKSNTKEVSLKTGSRMNAAKIVLSLWNSWLSFVCWTDSLLLIKIWHSIYKMKVLRELFGSCFISK